MSVCLPLVSVFGARLRAKSRCLALAVLSLLAVPSAEAALSATFNAATDVAVTTASYTPAGEVDFTLNFAPEPGTNLTVVKNTGLPFMDGTFSNLANGATVNLSYHGKTYPFVAWYYGGEGNNDLVLLWRYVAIAGWGDNDFGQLGDGTNTDSDNLPVRVDQAGVLAGKTIVQVARGGAHTLALTSEGRVYAWGHNVFGKLGNNTVSNNIPRPVEVSTENGVSALFGKTVISLAAGGDHSLVLCSDGTLVAWGRNQYGQLGDNSMQDRPTPVVVNTAEGSSALFGKSVVAVSAGYNHSLVLCSDGSMASWGANAARQLGDGTTTQRLTPVSTGNGSASLIGRSVVSIASGSAHNLALCSDGTLLAWGDNTYGELGDSTTTPRSEIIPVHVESGTSGLFGKTVVAIATGGLHSVALCSDGTVTTWGYNLRGQIGDNTVNDRLTPYAVTSGALTGKTVVGIGAGQNSTVALCSDGTIADWGVGTYYAYYDKIPVAVSRTGTSALSGVKATRIAGAGSNSSHAAAMYGALSKEITVRGNGQEIISGDMTPDIADRTDFGAVLLDSGPRVRTFTVTNKGLTELNLTGAPMIFISGTHADNFTVTTEPSAPVAPFVGTTTFQISFSPAAQGVHHATVSILSDDDDESPYTFAIEGRGSDSGFSFSDAMDVGVTANRYEASGEASLTLNFMPTPGTNLTVVKNTGPSFIEGAFSNLTNGATVNLSYNGKTYPFVVWYYGGEGNNDLVLLWPQTALAVWGDNTYGQLAVGNYASVTHRSPEVASTYGLLEEKTIVQVVQGGTHTLALTSEGKVYAWGGNNAGQLGDNTVVNRGAPVEVNTVSGVSSLAGKMVVAIAAGNAHSLALCSDGSVSAWGYNYDGQLGIGMPSNSSVPVAVSTTAGTSALQGKFVTSVASGSSHSLVLCADGTLVAWGGNSSGQLGDGSYTQRRLPVAVNTAEGPSALYGKIVVSVTGGAAHSLALCHDGSLVAWGENVQGQLGDGTQTTRPWPVAVSMSTSVLENKTVTAISTGGYHNLALCSDGTVAAWGYNSRGQLGDNSTQSRTLPVVVNATAPVSALAGKIVVSLACGAGHSLALCSDNTLASWGDNDSGQLGDPFTTNPLVPRSVRSDPDQYFGYELLRGRVVTGLPNRSGGCASYSSVVMLQGALRDISVMGNNQEIESGDMTPQAGDYTDFGDVPLGDGSVTRLFRIINKGVGDLTFTNSRDYVEISYGDLGIVRQPTSRYIVGGGTFFEIGCFPTTLGIKSATVTVRSDDPDKPVYTFKVQCFGRGSEIEVRDTGINVADGGTASFGNVGIGGGVVQKTFVINNLGNADLTGLTLTKGGLNSEDYTILVPPTAPVPPGGSTSFVVQAKPGGSGPRNATLHIANNDYNERNFDIAMTVTGVSASQPSAAKPAVTNITFEGATLKAEVNANGSERNVFFEYGTSSSYGGRVAATPAAVSGSTPTAVSAMVTGLLPNTKYYFSVRAEGVMGAANGEGKTFTTLNRPPVAVADSAVVLPGGQVVIPVLGNDVDVGDVLNIASFTQPPAAVGKVTKVGNTLVFTAAAAFAGGTFSYVAGDAYKGKSGPATVALTPGTCTIGPDVTVPSDSPPYELEVTANAPFGVIENVAWLSFVPPAANATSVTIIPAPNASKTERTATILVGGKAHKVTQSGVSELPALTVPAPIPLAAISSSYELAIPTQNGPVTYTAKGLPKGLTLSNVTGKITGYPTEAKTSTVTVKAKNVQGESNAISFDLTVLGIPASVVGSHSAVIGGSEVLTDKLGGLMTMTVTSAGGVSGTLKLGTGSHGFTGRLNTAEDPAEPDPEHAVMRTTVKRTGKPSLELLVRMNEPETDQFSAELTLPGAEPVTVEMVGGHHVWDAKAKPAQNHDGYYTMALQPTSTAASIPQGDGFLTMTVTPAGGVKWSGQLADGTVISAQSSALWADGRVPLFVVFGKGVGSLTQTVTIAAGARGVTGPLRWHKKPQAVRAYADGFEAATLQAVGGKYAPPLPGKTLLNQPAPFSYLVYFLGSGIEAVRNFTDLDQLFTMNTKHVISMTGMNPAQVKITKMDVTQGTFTGTMALKDTNPFNASLPEAARTVTFQGVVVPSIFMGTGYFLLPGITGPPLNVKTSAMTSGEVRISAQN